MTPNKKETAIWRVLFCCQDLPALGSPPSSVHDWSVIDPHSTMIVHACKSNGIGWSLEKWAIPRSIHEISMIYGYIFRKVEGRLRWLCGSMMVNRGRKTEVTLATGGFHKVCSNDREVKNITAHNSGPWARTEVRVVPFESTQQDLTSYRGPGA